MANNIYLQKSNGIERQKVILIGIDGADYHITKKFIEEDKLPNLKKIAEEGIYSKLKSTIPPLSPSAWTSIFTGCTPAKHGIYGFTKRRKDSYFPRPISSKDRKVDVIWNILSRHGKRCILINIPFSYPPEKINGIMITGLGTPSKDSNFVYPPEYKRIILEEFPDYDVDFGEDTIDKRKPNSVLPKIDKVTNAQIELTKKLFVEEDWDFFVSVFRSLDVIQHFFINDLEKILMYYEVIDNFIGWILSNIDLNNTTLIICSDHGFSYSHTNFNVNAWLRERGYIKVKRNIHIKDRALPSIEFIRRILARSNTGRKILYKAKNSNISKYILKLLPSSDINVNKIDWSKTKAYFWDGSFGLIYLNLKGREPEGIVEISERDKIIDEIISDIKRLREPKTGKCPVRAVFKGSDFYNSNDIDIPDIILLGNDGYCLKSGVTENIFIKREVYPGVHDIDGVFFAIGSKIKKSNVRVSDVTDIVPLILSIFNIKPSHQQLKLKILKMKNTIRIRKLYSQKRS